MRFNVCLDVLEFFIQEFDFFENKLFGHKNGQTILKEGFDLILFLVQFENFIRIFLESGLSEEEIRSVFSAFMWIANVVETVSL